MGVALHDTHGHSHGGGHGHAHSHGKPHTKTITLKDAMEEPLLGTDGSNTYDTTKQVCTECVFFIVNSNVDYEISIKMHTNLHTPLHTHTHKHARQLNPLHDSIIFNNC